MKICASCNNTLPPSSYSKKQWKSKQHERRCIECIEANRSCAGTPISLPSIAGTDATSVTSLSDTQLTLFGEADNVPSCYICLEECPDIDGKPLVRDCSCRGSDSGFAHISCIANYAAQKSKNWDKRRHDMYELILPWKVCANCHQPYQNGPAVDMANEFISYVNNTHPDDLGLLVAALKLKLGALGEYIYRQNMSGNSQGELKVEATDTANKLLSLITQMRLDNSSRGVSLRIRQIEAFVYLDLGQICFSEKTSDSAREAIGHFEKCRRLFKAMDKNAPGVQQGIICAENSVAATMLRYQDEGCTITLEEKLKHSRRMYKICTGEYGHEDAESIKVGTNLAIDLRNAKHSVEALRLLPQLVSTSKRVHGADHSLTKRVESTYHQYKIRRVLFKSQRGGWKHYQAIRYEDDFENIVIQGPLGEVKKDMVTFTVPSAAVLPSLGTPVVAHGLEPYSNHNGKIGDLRSWEKDAGSYEVVFEEKDVWPCSLKPKNFHILFDLGDP